MTLPVPAPPFPDAEILALARRARTANGGVMALVNRLGGTLESQMALIPAPVRDRLTGLTETALTRACGVAAHGARLGRLGQGGHLAVAGLAGAAGGFGGLATAAAELPFTITLILRGIQEVAEDHGFDPQDEAIQREVVQVFAAGSPLASDDGANTGFLGARLTLTGPALHRMIAAVAPKLAAALGQKLAAQTIPLLGAAAGAGLNLAYVRYYREMAQVRFGLLKLAQTHDPQLVSRAFARASETLPLLKS
jgi:hypothetical protein